MTDTDPRTPEELRREARDAEQHCRFARASRLRHKADCLEAQAQSDRAALVRSLRADVDAARRTHGELPGEDAIRFWARQLDIPAPELSAAIGTWPACADD